MTTNDKQWVRRLSSTPLAMAYRVPWRVDRRHAPTLLLVNDGPEPLCAVSVTISGAAIMRATAPRDLALGGGLPITVRGHDTERNTVLIVRWCRPNGDEYLWRVSV